MTINEFKALLIAIEDGNPLCTVARDLLGEITLNTLFQVHDVESKLANFEKIYLRRIEHLESKNIAFKGIRETIEIIKKYPDKVKTLSFTTEHFDGFSIINITGDKIIGLLYVVNEKRAGSHPLIDLAS